MFVMSQASNDVFAAVLNTVEMSHIPETSSRNSEAVKSNAIRDLISKQCRSAHEHLGMRRETFGLLERLEE